MLAGTRLEVFRNWWLTTGPASAFALTILSLTLLADGLREVLDPTLPQARPRIFRRRKLGTERELFA